RVCPCLSRRPVRPSPDLFLPPCFPSSPSPHSALFSFYCSGAHRDLHSFPTRRSSDLELPVEKNELARAPGLASSARSIDARIASLLVASPFVLNRTTFGGRSPVPNRSSDLWFAS